MLDVIVQQRKSVAFPLVMEKILAVIKMVKFVQENAQITMEMGVARNFLVQVVPSKPQGQKICCPMMLATIQRTKCNV